MSMFIFNKFGIKPSDIYDVYWKFACERQNIFYSRLNNTFPWTNDEILCKYKFTNAYRASDRVSQYLIKNVIYNGMHSAEDTVFRILFFKLFNKIETWQYIENELGEISYKSFSFDKYDKILMQLLQQKTKIYSGAYIMPSGTCFGYHKKHQNNLSLLETMMKNNLSGKIAKCKSLEALYRILLSYPTIGKFLAFQYAIDINYSEMCDFSEMEYVVAGPGAISGISKCFIDTGKYTPEDIIKIVTEIQGEEFERLELKFKKLGNRSLNLIDCQNLFCETDKYTRVSFPEVIGINKRTKIKQLFTANLNNPIEYFYPPKWNVIL